MTKKTLLIALAVVAALTVAGVGAARCAVSAMGPGTDGGPATEAVETEEQQLDDEGGAEVAAQPGEAVNALEILTTHVWTAADGSGTTLEFREGAWVEKGAALEATAYEQVSEIETSSQAVLTVTPIRNGLSADPVAIIVGGKEGSYTVSSDAFALCREYVQGAAATTDFKVTGVDARFYELAGTDEESLEKALSDHCRKRVPSASSASFDGEVFVDLKSGLCSATFHADDASRTIVTVTSQSGQLTVA